MTFLELCQAVAAEGGISGGVVSVAGQTGEALRVVNWVKRAYGAIQRENENWEFLRADVLFTTTADTDTYTAAAAGVASLGEWHLRSMWRYYALADGVANEQPLEYMPYNKFRNVCGFGNARLQKGPPQVFTVRPNQALQLWPVPDAEFAIVGEQYMAPQQLVANDSVPIFAATFHDAIMHRALMYYGEHEGDATVFNSAQAEFKSLLVQMEDRYLPAFDTCLEPLA